MQGLEPECSCQANAPGAPVGQTVASEASGLPEQKTQWALWRQASPVQQARAWLAGQPLTYELVEPQQPLWER